MAKKNKEIQTMLEIAESQGCTWRVTQNSHYQVRDRNNRVIALVGSTPSDNRALKNFRADLRRGGVEL